MEREGAAQGMESTLLLAAKPIRTQMREYGCDLGAEEAVQSRRSLQSFSLSLTTLFSEYQTRKICKSKEQCFKRSLAMGCSHTEVIVFHKEPQL